MIGIYVCIVPVISSPIIAEIKENLERKGYVVEKTPMVESWCKRAESLELAKSIIREVNSLGFGTNLYVKNNREIFVHLHEENADAWNALNSFKQERGLV